MKLRAAPPEVIAVRRSALALFTRREGPGWADETADLCARAGLVRRVGSGLYAFAPVGERVRRNVAAVLRDELRAIGAQEVSLPQLTPRGPWEASGRWANFEGEMFTLLDRDGRECCLAPSHEEGAVELVRGAVRSSGDLPLLIFQLGAKHRDDRPRAGLVRTREFAMKDAYSFHASRECLTATYDRVRAAYVRAFEALGLEFAVAAAENSVMGGARSEEFLAVVAPDGGSTTVLVCDGADCRFGATDESPNDFADGDPCPDCDGTLVATGGIEVGHVFDLGTRYSTAMDLTIDAPDGSARPVPMGSYGIGIDRLIHAILLQHADAAGCRWPETDAGSVAPFRASIVPLRYESDLREAADRLHRACGPEETLLFDDPGQTIGERFAESDLLGIPRKIVLGSHYRETGEIEIENRDGETRYVDPDAVTEVVGP
ncbi:aminoacyl--tRNA ligase-related protein [Halovivax sp.]|uniref:aminoacyl--tRNA ligase-related protein n=1 Tax=Halovivax sp. TaxID=1935978 RepID=UPI0025BE134C|nr:aminoacyl--tRNA ligase-related protein [Halovivax sp.]